MIEHIKEALSAKLTADKNLQELLNRWARENCPFKKDETVTTDVHPGKWKVEEVIGKLDTNNDPYWELDVTNLSPEYWIHAFTAKEGVRRVEK